MMNIKVVPLAILSLFFYVESAQGFLYAFKDARSACFVASGTLAATTSLATVISYYWVQKLYESHQLYEDKMQEKLRYENYALTGFDAYEKVLTNDQRSKISNYKQAADGLDCGNQTSVEALRDITRADIKNLEIDLKKEPPLFQKNKNIKKLWCITGLGYIASLGFLLYGYVFAN